MKEKADQKEKNRKKAGTPDADFRELSEECRCDPIESTGGLLWIVQEMDRKVWKSLKKLGISFEAVQAIEWLFLIWILTRKCISLLRRNARRAHRSLFVLFNISNEIDDQRKRRSGISGRKQVGLHYLFMGSSTREFGDKIHEYLSGRSSES